MSVPNDVRNLIGPPDIGSYDSNDPGRDDPSRGGLTPEESLYLLDMTPGANDR